MSRKIWDSDARTAIYIDRVVGIQKKENHNGNDDYVRQGGGCIGSTWTIRAILDSGSSIPLESIPVTSPAYRSKGYPRERVDERLEHWIEELDRLREIEHE